MAQLFGREYELNQGRQLLALSRHQRVGRLLHIVGEPGVGKTALAMALAEDAAASGWFVAIAVAQRGQSALPLESARRVLNSLLAALGPEGPMYSSGLEETIYEALSPTPINRDAMAAALFRLLEGASIDRPVLVVIDDAQWADHDSRRLIVKTLHALSDRSISIISTERNDERDDRAIDYRDEIIHLAALAPDAARALAKAMLPGASLAVIDTIHLHARGRPLDIIALAATTINPSLLQPSDIAATLGSVIARDVAHHDDALREFLQTCSLISDPIDYRILRQIWPDDEVLNSKIERSAHKYLVQSDGGLRFVHDAVRSGLIETIDDDEGAAYHRRIIESIKSLPSLSIEDRQRLVEHAAALGDIFEEQRFLRDLCEVANREQVLPVLASALERLIEIMPFSPEDSLPLYAQLSVVYNGLERTDDANRISLLALDLAVAHEAFNNIGQVLVSLLFTLHFKNNRPRFDATVKRFEPYLASPSERAHLLSAKLFIADCDSDDEAFDRTHREFLSLDIHHIPYTLRYHTFNALRLGSRGDLDASLHEINRARTLCLRKAPVFRAMVDSADAYLSVQIFGPGHPFVAELLLDVPRTRDYWAYVSAVRLLCEGSTESALSHIAESLLFLPNPLTQHLLLGVAATATALSDTPAPHALMMLVDRSARDLVNNLSTGWPLPLAAGWAATIADRDPELARALMHTALQIVTRRPIESCVFFYPQVFVKAAAALRDERLLRDIANSALQSNALPFNAALHDLARLSARAQLDHTVDPREAMRIAEALDRLGAPFFSRFAWELSKRSRKTALPTKVLTKREREIAEHVALGKTNREIAQELTLSERTVEAHIANIYAKTDVGSRAHLASWMIRNA